MHSDRKIASRSVAGRHVPLARRVFASKSSRVCESPAAFACHQWYIRPERFRATRKTLAPGWTRVAKSMGLETCLSATFLEGPHARTVVLPFGRRAAFKWVRLICAAALSRTGGRGKCDLPHFREEELTRRLGWILKDIYVPDSVVSDIQRSMTTEKTSRTERLRSEEIRLSATPHGDSYPDGSGLSRQAGWKD